MINYQLRITNVHGFIGIKTNDAVLSIRQPKAKMEIKTEPARVDIETTRPQVIIDQSQCFSEAGLKSSSELTDEAAERGRQAVLEGIARIVSEGNRMADIKNKTDAIGDIAAAKVFRPPDDFNITLMPKSRPKIDVVGDITFTPRPGNVDIRVVPMQPEINATAPDVQVYMRQQPYFSIEFVGNNLDVNA